MAWKIGNCYLSVLDIEKNACVYVGESMDIGIIFFKLAVNSEQYHKKLESLEQAILIICLN